MASDDTPKDTNAAARPRLGHFELITNLGHSARTASWLVIDTRTQAELVLVMPKQALEASHWPEWLSRVSKLQRVDSRHLMPIFETGQLVGRPYAAYERGDSLTLGERVKRGPMGLREALRILHQLAQALTDLHETRSLHRDLQPHLVLIDGKRVRVCGAEVGWRPAAAGEDPLEVERTDLRENTPVDLFFISLMLHWLISGEPPLGESDFLRAMSRLPPDGDGRLELPEHKVAALSPPIRHIYERALNTLPRQRFATARSLASALEDVLQNDEGNGPNVLATLRERIRLRGILPGNEDTLRSVVRLSRMQVSHQAELVAVMLQDTALSLELLRVCNNTLRKGSTLNANDAVLNMRRAMALTGLNGVEQAAKNLTLWPGPLNRYQARDLEDDIWQIRRASLVAQHINPGAFEPETVFIIALFHGLGQLILGYHFPEEALQIKHLVRQARQEKSPPSPWEALDSACKDVLELPLSELAAEVLRLWGMEDDVIEMLQPLPAQALQDETPPDDSLFLRAIVSCAYEVFVHKDTVKNKRLKALNLVAQRYTRWLGCTAYTLNDALTEALRGSEHRVMVGTQDILEDSAGAAQAAGAASASTPTEAASAETKSKAETQT